LFNYFHEYATKEGEEIGDFKWDSGEPSGEYQSGLCVMLIVSGGEYKMDDRLCSDNHYFVCEFESTFSFVLCVHCRLHFYLAESLSSLGPL
jgi:hypothetical protein